MWPFTKKVDQSDESVAFERTKVFGSTGYSLRHEFVCSEATRAARYVGGLWDIIIDTKVYRVRGAPFGCWRVEFVCCGLVLSLDFSDEISLLHFETVSLHPLLRVTMAVDMWVADNISLLRRNGAQLQPGVLASEQT